MSFDKEINRINLFIENEKPSSSFIEFAFQLNHSNPNDVLIKIKSVLMVVSHFNKSNWPSDITWNQILPNWFVNRISNNSLEMIKSDKRIWHFESWLDAVKFRNWEWYSSNIKDNTITITLLINDIPFIVEPFEYIIYECGVDYKNINYKTQL